MSIDHGLIDANYKTLKDYALFGTEVLDIITTFSTSDS